MQTATLSYETFFFHSFWSWILSQEASLPKLNRTILWSSAHWNFKILFILLASCGKSMWQVQKAGNKPEWQKAIIVGSGVKVQEFGLWRCHLNVIRSRFCTMWMDNQSDHAGLTGRYWTLNTPSCRPDEMGRVNGVQARQYQNPSDTQGPWEKVVILSGHLLPCKAGPN